METDDRHFFNGNRFEFIDFEDTWQADYYASALGYENYRDYLNANGHTDEIREQFRQDLEEFMSNKLAKDYETGEDDQELEEMYNSEEFA